MKNEILYIDRRLSIFIALCFFVLLTFVANWSILLGTNLMKWDIWMAEYPMQSITSDAIASGIIPLWNPLLQFGTPYYAMIGTPVWYPITLLLCVIGYGPYTPALEYSIHIVVGAMGMFMLGLTDAPVSDDRISIVDIAVAIATGTMYSFSGVFLSNAQHIMIIISVAWIPWALMSVKRYCINGNIKDLMESGIFLALILLGGYPEIFYDTVLVLFVWIVYWSLDKQGERYNLKFIAVIFKRYFFTIINALLAAAITIIPFAFIMPHITRGSGQTIMSFPLSSLMSLFIPITADMLSGNELSMGLFYIGIFTMISILYSLSKKETKDTFYIICAFITLILCFGPGSYLHTLLYRFLPLYSSFRFSTLWRIMFALFAILACRKVWTEIILEVHTDINRSIVYVLKCATILSVIVYVCSYVNASTKESSSSLVEALLLLIGILLMYYCFITFRVEHKCSRNLIAGLLVVLISAEVLAISHKAFAVTIAQTTKEAYFNHEDTRNAINSEQEEWNNRNKSSEFANSSRSVSGLNSKAIAINKTFDEEGYLSVILSKKANYHTTANRTIIRSNPEVYFTNDIVTDEDVPLDTWLNDESVDAYQIHITENPDIDINTSSDDYSHDVNIKHFGFNDIEIEVESDVDGIVTILQVFYRWWDAYVDGQRVDISEVNGCFIGVPVEAGRHSIVLKFVPWDFYAGFTVTCVYMMVFIIVVIRSRKRKG